MQSLSCDYCGEMLKGKKGTAFVNEDYIEISGGATACIWNQDTRKHEFLHVCINRKPYHFCDTDCFKDFRHMRVLQIKEEWEKNNTYAKENYNRMAD